MRDLAVARIWIPGKFPNLNDYIEAERRHRMIAAKMKKEWTGIVADIIKTKSIPPLDNVTYPVTVHFIVHEKDRRRDIDNITATVSKFCLDGMVTAGFIPNDSQKYVNKIECDIIVSNDIGVEIVIYE